LRDTGLNFHTKPQERAGEPCRSTCRRLSPPKLLPTLYGLLIAFPKTSIDELASESAGNGRVPVEVRPSGREWKRKARKFWPDKLN